MKPCWPEGDLRACLDGELPPGLRDALAAHLSECPECRARHRELSARAARVADLLALLPPEGRYAPRPPVAPRPASYRRHRAVAALSLAAALALAFVLLPRRGVPPRPAAPPAPATALLSTPSSPSPDHPPVRPRPAIRRAAAPPPAASEPFLRLDDDPIETGTVVRVSAENGDVQADLLIGPDGRAHAIRMIGNR